MKKWAIGFFSLGIALICTQIPDFFHHYSLTLATKLEEIDLQLTILDERATLSDMDRYDFIRKMKKDESDVLRKEGAYQEMVLGQQHALREHKMMLDDVTPKTFFAIIPKVDSKILWLSLHDYQPKISDPKWVFMYFIGGFFASYATIWLIILILLPPFLYTKKRTNL